MEQGRLTLVRPYRIVDRLVVKVSDQAPEFSFLMQFYGGIHQAGGLNVRVQMVLRGQGKNDFLEGNTFRITADRQIRVASRNRFLTPLADPVPEIPINRVGPIMQLFEGQVMVMRG